MPLTEELQENEGQLAETIQLILDKYANLTGDPQDGSGGEELALEFGNLVRDENDAPPRVSWIETGGTAEKGRGAGGSPFEVEGTDDTEAYGDWVDLDVEIWCKTGNLCRLTKNNLIAAAVAVLAADFRYDSYIRVPDLHDNDGVVFKMTCQVRLPVPLNGTNGHPYMVQAERHFGELVDHDMEQPVNVRFPLDDPDP